MCHDKHQFKLFVVCATDGTDCSLTFVAHTLGKVCIQGHSGEFFFF